MVLHDEILAKLYDEKRKLVLKADKATNIAEKDTINIMIDELQEKINNKIQEILKQQSEASVEMTEAVLPIPDTKKSRSSFSTKENKVNIEEKKDIGKEIIELLDSKGYNDIQKRKILSNAYQQIYKRRNN